MARGDADDLRSYAPAPTTRSTWSAAATRSSVAGIDFRTFDVPGHTAGSVAFASDGVAFVGDVLFAGSIGRTDLDGGDLDTLLREHRAADAGAARRDRGRAAATARPPRSSAELATNPFLGRSAVSERFQPPRGTRDWYGEDAAVRRHVIDLARSVFEPAGYGEVVTPGFEDTRAVRALVRRDVRRGQQGDVHLQRPQRPVADAAARRAPRR